MAGRWFEQFEVGQRFDHEIRRTVTEADNMWFSNATCNPVRILVEPTDRERADPGGCTKESGIARRAAPSQSRRTERSGREIASLRSQ